MPIMHSAPGPETIIDGRQYLYFCGTGYLGLHGHEALIQASCDALRQYGLGTATTRAVYGNAPPTLEVETRAAQFWGCEESFFFASGYLGNHVLLSALAPAAAAIFLDEHAHFSVSDACRFFDLPVHRFAHRDAQSLREVLRAHLSGGQVPVVMSDGVFAVRGSIAPVPDYVDVLQPYRGAMLCLDDCHAFGVLGQRGRGTYEYFGFEPETINARLSRPEQSEPGLYVAGTLSKAFGSYGGIVSGSTEFIEQVKRASHYFRAASAPPIPVAAAGAAALKLVSESPERVTQVQQNARLLRQRLRRLGVDVEDTPVPIISLALGDQVRMRRVQQALADEGILIALSENYAGLDAHGALRIAVFANHTPAMIERLAASMEKHL